MLEINVTSENFENEVISSSKPVLVDFWASWCGPCKMLAPVISEIADEYKDKLKVCKINIDDDRDLALKYEVEAIPTLILFENGIAKKTSVGFHTKSELKEFIG